MIPPRYKSQSSDPEHVLKHEMEVNGGNGATATRWIIDNPSRFTEMEGKKWNGKVRWERRESREGM